MPKKRTSLDALALSDTPASGERIKLSEQNTFTAKIANAVYNDVFESAREIDPSLKIEVFFEEFVGDCSDDFTATSPRLEFTSSPKVAEIVAHIPKTPENVIRIHDALRSAIGVNTAYICEIVNYAWEIDPELRKAPILQREEVARYPRACPTRWHPCAVNHNSTRFRAGLHTTRTGLRVF